MMHHIPSPPKRSNSSVSYQSFHTSKSISSVPGDSSMQKSILTKRKQQLYHDYLLKEKNRIIGLKEIRKMHENLIVSKPKPHIKAEKILKRNKAAVTIQKMVRGWLVRKMYETDFIKLSQNLTSKLLQDLCSNIPTLLLFGRNCLSSVKTIQKAFRNYKLRQKLARLQRVYEVTVKYNTRRQAKRLLRKFLRTVMNKNRLLGVKNDLETKIKLFNIRIKLALCTIKNFMKKNGIGVVDITLAYRTSKWTKLGISLLEPKPNSSETEVRRKGPMMYSRVYVQAYKPVLSERGSKYFEPGFVGVRGSRVLEPTQASCSRTRIKFVVGNGHKRNKSDYSIFSKPTRPCTPFR